MVSLLLGGVRGWIFTKCVILDKYLNVLSLSFLICEIRLDYVILLSPVVLKVHGSVTEMIETFCIRAECPGRKRSFQKVPYLLCDVPYLSCSDIVMGILMFIRNRITLLWTDPDKILILYLSSLSSSIHDVCERF